MKKCEKAAAVTGITCSGCRQAYRRSVSVWNIPERCFRPRRVIRSYFLRVF